MTSVTVQTHPTRLIRLPPAGGRTGGRVADVYVGSSRGEVSSPFQCVGTLRPSLTYSFGEA